MTTDIAFAQFERIYPTENDIAFAPYNGVNGSEVNFSKNLNARRPKNCVLPELDGSANPTLPGGFVTTIGALLSVNVTRGRAYIEGRYVELVTTTASYNIPVTTNSDTYLYLTLNISGVVSTLPPARFTTVTVAHGAQHTRPANSTLLSYIVSNATNVTAVTDMRCSQFHNSVYLPMTDTKKYFVSVPDFGFTTILGGVAMLWRTAGLPGLTTVTLTVQGPQGTITKVYNNVPTGTSAPLAELLNVSIAITPNIGRYAGGKVQVFLTQANVQVKIATNDQGVPINGFGTINETAGTWYFKEWDAPN
jgi:hypothetical protein